MMNFESTDEFFKDLKRLSKKYRSLSQDLEEFKKVIKVFPCGTGKHFATLLRHQAIQIIKARFFCRYLRGASLRVIYAYDENKKQIEFIELYYKGERERESSERIRRYLLSFET